MNQSIPTAEEIFEKYSKRASRIQEMHFDEMLIEFAKIHVEAALKEAAQKASLLEDNKKVASPRYIIEDSNNNNYNQTEIDIDKDSILDAYPLTNIK